MLRGELPIVFSREKMSFGTPLFLLTEQCEIGETMTVYIDADGCPVVDATVRIAGKHNILCVIICDTSHVFEKQGATTITVSKGSDSVDFALVNLL